MSSRHVIRILLLVGLSACSVDPQVTAAELAVAVQVTGTFSGPEPLQTSWVVVPDGGRMVVAVHRRHLTILDTLGKVTALFGREGQGPGEFLSTPLVGTMADSVWTIDRQLGRVMVIHPDDGGYRSGTLIFGGGKPDNASVQWGLGKGMIENGGYLVAASAVHRSGLGATVPTTVLARASRPDSLEAVLLSDPMDTDCILPNNGRTAIVLACQRLLHLVAPDGRSATAVTRHRDVEGGVELRLTRVSFTGDTVMTTIVAFPARIMTNALRDSLIEATERMMRFPVDGSDFKAPMHLGPIWYGYQGNDGSLWLMASGSSRARQWFLVDPDGTLVGGFRLDAELTLGAVSRDAAWAVRDREDGRADLVRIKVTR
ncbi:MAG: hypothetical protein U0974_01475 [Gemmatimonadales bacterium]|nr:hypothetical protein [Gemmatimonadales bacterium]MDZ4388387.1 hypothetical protein [Gemmatimonadales bacterium]